MDTTSSHAPNRNPGQRSADRIGYWLTIGFSVAILVFFYAWVPRYNSARTASAFGWLYSAWNPETDYEHGILFPFLIAGLIIYQLKAIRAAAGDGSAWGLGVVVLGTLLYAAAYRTLQPRVAIGALPFLLWGSALFLWGWRAAKLLAFPLFFLWMSVPLPGFQQATVGLQHLSAQLAHLGSSVFGVETIVKGTDIIPVNGNWKAMSIAGGCSGIRSLMALLMISAAWAYVAKVSLWKKAVLFFAAVPLAILGNALRLTSIFVIAQYGNPEWARGTWHDWSGLALFYPISLFLLLCLHSVLEGGIPWKSAKRRQIRRTVVNNAESSPFQPES